MLFVAGWTRHLLCGDRQFYALLWSFLITPSRLAHAGNEYIGINATYLIPRLRVFVVFSFPKDYRP